MDAYQSLAKKAVSIADETVGNSEQVHKHIVGLATGDLTSNRHEQDSGDEEPGDNHGSGDEERVLENAEASFQHATASARQKSRKSKSTKKDKKRKSAKPTPKPKSTSGGATVAPEKLLQIKLKGLHSTWNLRKHADACVSARAALDSSDQNKEVRSSLKQRAALARSKAQGIEDEDLSSD